ncbi:Uncharacterised protein [Vibrio cholerae]|nr:Uncharacterised protein [Vibrio cholerae]
MRSVVLSTRRVSDMNGPWSRSLVNRTSSFL